MSDLEQLQREYRHMEQNRKAYAEESHSVLRKQQQAIDKLRRDNDGLKTEIAMQMRTSLKPANNFQQSMIEKLGDQMDKYSKQIEMEKKSIAAMDDAIAVLRDKILKERKNMGGVNAARDNQQMIQKQIRILENRLDKALVKFNQSLAANRALREQIDDLRRERVVFDNIYKKLEKELHEKKKQMAHVIQLTNMTYEQRDNCQMEITAIDQANRKEQEDFEEQMLELGRMLEQDFKLQTSKSAGDLGASGGGGSAKKTKKSTMRETSKEKIEAQASMERVQNFEEAFNKIRAATGIEDIEVLVRTFIKNEDQNFSLFNYVNEQTNEIEKLEEQVMGLRKEEQKYVVARSEEQQHHHSLSSFSRIFVPLFLLSDLLLSFFFLISFPPPSCFFFSSLLFSFSPFLSLSFSLSRLFFALFFLFSSRYTQESGDDVINQHKQILKELETKLQASETHAEKYEVKCTGAQKTIESLKKGIQTMFEKLECRSEILADSSVTEANMLQFLGIIEQRTNEILAVYHQIQTKQRGAMALADSSKGAATPNVLGLGPTIPMGQDLIHVNPPKLEEFSDEEGESDDDDDAKPLTRDELKEKAHARITQKRGGGKGEKKKGGKR